MSARSCFERPFIGRTALALLLLGRSFVGHAQSLTVPPGTSWSEIVAAAETDGRIYPRSNASTASAPRTCVTGWDVGPASSGEFTIGGEISDRLPLRAGKVGKIWWKPANAAANMPPLLVRGRNLSSPTDTVLFRSTQIAWQGVAGAPPDHATSRSYFFPSGFSVPSPGRWVVIATSGRNWGCFIVTAR